MSYLLKATAWLGTGFAIVLIIVETVHNWGDWSDPALWIIDYFACALLLAGASVALKGDVRGPALLGTAWGFACAMFWMAYFIIVSQNAAIPGTHDPLVVNFALGLFLTTIVGLALSLTVILGSPKQA